MSIVQRDGRTPMTRQGHARLRAELERLVTGEREAVARRLRLARADGGDASENGELMDALEEQALLEHRIQTLQARLAAARVAAATDDGTAGIGTRVRLRTSAGRDIEYELVGAGEAEGVPHRISIESPVGQALLGCRPGARIVVEAPRRTRHLELLAVEPLEPRAPLAGAA